MSFGRPQCWGHGARLVEDYARRFVVAFNEADFLKIVSGLSAGQRDVVKRDWERGKAVFVFELSAKFDFWNHLPHKLCALPARDQDAARVAIAECIIEWDNLSPDAKRQHHDVAKRFLREEGELRPLVDEFLQGKPLRSLPKLRSAALKLKYIHIVERSIEGKHRYVKLAHQHVPSAGASYISLALRLQELDDLMGNTPW